MPQLAEALGAGGARALELRFLPGWRSEEMANYLRVVRPARIDPDEFLTIVQTQQGLDTGAFSFLGALPAGATLEGYLFPDAYTITPDTDAAALVGMMLANFDRQVTPATVSYTHLDVYKRQVSIREPARPSFAVPRRGRKRDDRSRFR